MPGVEDVLLPILQKIQADVADIRRRVERIETDQASLRDGVDKIESYVTYSLGLITQSRADMERQGRSLIELGRRVELLETSN